MADLIIPDPVKFQLKAPFKVDRVQLGAASMLPGKLIYLDRQAARWKLAQANADATKEAAAMLMSAGGVDDWGIAIFSGSIKLDTVGLTKATQYVLSAANAGGIAPRSDLAAGNRLVEFAVAEDTEFFSVDFLDTEITI